MYHLLTPIFVACIYGLPLAVVGVAYAFWPEWWVLLVTLFAAPLVYPLVFVLTAGLLSVPFHRAIVAGRFPRDLTHPIYRARRLYGLCWTCLYYFKPVYFVCLSVPELKWLTFRLFGYRGPMNFTVYPDTWIRDLPLLDFGEGAYIANRATLGTNVVLSNGQILVDAIRVGNGAMVGHLAMLAPGVVLGHGAEVGAGCVLGAGCRVGEGALVQPLAGVNHSSQVGDRTIVGGMSSIGASAVVGDGLRLPSGTLVPNGAAIRSQEQVGNLFSSTLGELKALASRIREWTAVNGHPGPDTRPAPEQNAQHHGRC
jgi:carbonic anhydrase/acetyltransferase-like protein (isoleucine patch superfamily)